MSQTIKMVFIAIVAVLLGGISVYVWQNSVLQGVDESNNLSVLEEGAAKYNCELSDGSFKDGKCECLLEVGQTQESMYDKTTGFCQSSIGSPAGDAFAASAGLPFGDYSFYNDVVQNNCTETGGEFLFFCTCAEGALYDKKTGYCK